MIHAAHTQKNAQGCSTAEPTAGSHTHSLRERHITSVGVRETRTAEGRGSDVVFPVCHANGGGRDQALQESDSFTVTEMVTRTRARRLAGSKLGRKVCTERGQRRVRWVGVEVRTETVMVDNAGFAGQIRIGLSTE